MNYKIVFYLAVGGLITGVCNVLGVTGQQEWIMWTIFWIIGSLLIHRKVNQGAYIHAGASGFAFAFCCYSIQFILFSEYIQNNPQFIEHVKALGDGSVNPRTFLLSMGLILSVANAAILFFLTLGLEYFSMQKRV
ncbi:MAG: hypothetical protein LWX56_05455 [Ignavibacteria bacterium]|nr:hypothetical protein [Ignavibacteria bacterium]